MSDVKTGLIAACAALALIQPAAAQSLYNRYYNREPAPQYNPFDNRWEMTYPDAQLNYNPFDNSWQYTAPNATPQYNPFNNRWEFPH